MKLKKVGRRVFLRGAGAVVVGLPLLESLTRGPTQAQERDASFAVWVRQANGVAQASVEYGNAEPERFWPRTTGALTRDSLMAETGRAVRELAPYAHRMLMIAGLRHPFGGQNCGHANGGNQCLTATSFTVNPSGPNLSRANGESVDNYIARVLNPRSNPEPLTLMTGPRNAWIPEVMSYRGPGDLRSAEHSPLAAYRRLFGMVEREPDVEVARRLRRASVNDTVREELQSLLRRDLSAADRRRIDLHLSSIRDLEVSMSCRLAEMDAMERDAVDPYSARNYQAVTRLHMDVIAVAIACGHTRSATLQLGEGNSGWQFEIPGVNGGNPLPRFHQLSHRINSDGARTAETMDIPEAHLLHHEIDKMHLQLFRHLLDRLEEVSVPGGRTLLDVGTACMMYDIAAGVTHSFSNVPYLFAGSLGGNLRNGLYVDVRRSGQYLPTNAMFDAVLNAAGVRKPDGSLVDDFGTIENDAPRGDVDAIIDPSGPAWR